MRVLFLGALGGVPAQQECAWPVGGPKEAAFPDTQFKGKPRPKSGCPGCTC